MRLRKASIAPALTAAALAVTSSFDSASAQREIEGHSTSDTYAFQRAPRPSQSLPGATSRPSNRDMRGTPSPGGRVMRGGAAARTVREQGLVAVVSDAPENLRMPRATSRPSNRNMRGAPDKGGGRGMRGGMGGGRMNSGMGGRR